jgi:hypothetical protein
MHAGKTEEIYYMGDVLNVGNNSTVVNRSAIYNSLNNASSGLDVKSQIALNELTREVIRSGSQDAEENLEGFLAELREGSPRRSVLSSLLNDIAAMVWRSSSLVPFKYRKRPDVRVRSAQFSARRYPLITPSQAARTARRVQ